MKTLRIILYLAVAGFIAAAIYLTIEYRSTRDVQIKPQRVSTNNIRGSSTNQHSRARKNFIRERQRKQEKDGTLSTEIHAGEYNKVGEPKLLLFNKSKCSASPGDRITLLYVYSSPENVLRRDFIRNTYGSETSFSKYNLRTVFVLGKQLLGFNITDQIIEEQVKHEDLVVGNFAESYRNLARKGLAALNFLHNWCKNAKFVIKTDDDSIMDTKAVLQMLYTDFVNDHRLLIGRKFVRKKPLRCKPVRKWCVDEKTYNRARYPPFVYGAGFAFTYDLVADMYDESVRVPLLPLDDVYFTGILVENLNKTFFDLGKKFACYKFYTVRRIRAGEETLIGHTKGLEDMKIAWELLNTNKTVYVPRIGVDFKITAPMSKHKDNTVI